MSRTFPGWHAAAVHTALNEIERSVQTCAELERVGRTLGERDGTGPDDDPMLRSLLAEARAEGFAKGFLESRAEAEAKGCAEDFLKSRAEAVHTILNEIGPVSRTHAALERVGRALGERDGTGPDDDPMLRSLRARRRAEGFAEGRAKAKAWVKGFVESRAGMMREVLRVRGIPCSENLLAGIPDGLPASVIAAAALACDSQRDFYARLRAHVESD